MALLEDPDQAGPELAGLMADAHASYRGLSRKGFTDADVEDEENLGVFEAGADILSQLKVTLQNFTDRLGQMVLEGEDWRDQYQLDRQIFAQQFKKLYGDH